jgi:hypothetical protein
MYTNPKHVLLWFFGVGCGTFTIFGFLFYKFGWEQLCSNKCRTRQERATVHGQWLATLLCLCFIVLVVGGPIMGSRQQQWQPVTATYYVHTDDVWMGNSWGTILKENIVLERSEPVFITVDGERVGVPVETSSPLPAHLPADAWTDGSYITFRNPATASLYFFATWAGITSTILAITLLNSKLS